MTKVSKIEDLSILALFEIKIERVERSQLVKYIKVEVPNTASISKDILFHVSKFLESRSFNLFDIIE